MRGVERLMVILLLAAAVAIPACSQQENLPGGEGTHGIRATADM